MRKKVYQKPSIKPVALRQKTQMLSGSDNRGVQASRSSYGKANQIEWDSE